MRIAVIDGQGGGIGRHIVEKLRRELPEDVEFLALGTNALATSAMLRAGANEGATGENAVVYNARRVDLIVGPLSILVPNAMLGELTPEMALAVADSPARKVLIPLSRSGVEIVGLRGEPLPHLIEELIKKVKEILQLSGRSGGEFA
jgi:NAD(P)-dependent dehydrogenase (short-subunit alcohol dehydrogenase family)